MSQSAQLLTALKRQLKTKGITYKTIAAQLKLSEASVKRLFNSGQMSLERLESITQLANLRLSDLLAQSEQEHIKSLTLEQEEQIASDISLLMVAVSVLCGFSFKDLHQHYHLDEHTLIQKLAQLDRLKLLELQPGNHIRLRIAPHFQWQPNGPIQRFFLQRVAADFLASDFKSATEQLLVHNGLCSTTTNQKIQQRMQRFIREANALIEDDKKLPLDQKHGNTLVLALRQWQFAEFKVFNRNKLDT